MGEDIDLERIVNVLRDVSECLYVAFAELDGTGGECGPASRAVALDRSIDSVESLVYDITKTQAYQEAI